MIRLIWVSALCMVQLPGWANFPSHILTICSTQYKISASLQKKHGGQVYVVTIDGSGVKARSMELGKILNERSKAAIQQALKDSLHNADIFPPCPGQAGATFQQIELMIDSLVSDAFPNSHVSSTEVVIDDNNKLYLLQESSRNSYEITDLTPSGPVSLFSFVPASRNYAFQWAALSANVVLTDHFDQLVGLYFKVPSTAVKPSLYLLFRAGTSDYEVIYSDDGRTGHPSGAIISKETMKKLATVSVETISIGGARSTLLKIVDPFSKDAPKKPKDEPKYKEEK